MKEKKSRIAIPTEEEVAEYAEASETDSSTQREEASDELSVESLQAQIAEYQDKLLRAQAECANITRRLQQQHAASLELAGMDIARALLPVRDSFDRTLENMNESEADDPVVEGVRLIADQLRKVLTDHGVEPIEALGKPFDPKLHEAMMQDHQSDLPVGTITNEIQRGYTMRGHVLRPAKVAVAAEDEPSGAV